MLDPIQLYAEMALMHASEEYSVQPHALNPMIHLDGILDREREKAIAERIDSIATSYGCWIGNWLIGQCHAKWINLNDATPPRVQIGERIYSPIEAVRRRLLSDTAPRLSLLLKQAMEHQRVTSNASIALTLQQAWNDRATDPRFVNSETEAIHAEGAFAAMDPWIREGFFPG